MDKHTIGRSPDVVPLIAKLHEAQRAYKAEKNKNDGIRAQLSSTVAQVLELQITEREGELVADVLIELMRQAEKDVRHALSEQLATQDNVPLRLVLQLANDDIDVARPILMSSPVLGDFDLIYIIKSRTPEYWHAIATRKALGDQVIDVLAETRDFDTAVALAENMAIKLTPQALTVMSDLAQGSEILSVPLLRRNDVPEDLTKALYKFVGEEMKKFIRKDAGIEATSAEQAVDALEKVVSQFTETSPYKDLMPEEFMINAAQAFKQKGLLNAKLMVGTLRRGHIRSFVAQFANHAELPIHKVCQILSQSSGQALAFACKAYDIDKQDFVSMFMLTSKIRDHGRMAEMDEVRKAVSYYNLIKKDAALEYIRSRSQH